MKTRTIGLIMGVLLMMSLGTAALLTHYGTISSSAKVSQSVTLSGANCTGNVCTFSEQNVVAGNSYTHCGIDFENHAENPIGTKFVTVITDSGSNDASDAVTVEYLDSVKLMSKYTNNWTVKNDGREAIVTFDMVDSTFNYDIEAKGLDSQVAYSLIYYADYPDDGCGNYGGDNPGAFIGEFTTDCNGKFSTSGSVDLDLDLADQADRNWNMDASEDFCDYHNGVDDYDLCEGAKLWLVESSEYDQTNKKITSWTYKNNFLYETDMVTYDDTTWSAGGQERLYVGSGKIDMCVKVTFSPLTTPDTYTVSTTIVPVV